MGPVACSFSQEKTPYFRKPQYHPMTPDMDKEAAATWFLSRMIRLMTPCLPFSLP